MNFLDFLFPKRCVSCGRIGNYFCKRCISQVEFLKTPICPVCQRSAVGGRTHPGCLGKYNLDGLAVVCRYKGSVRRAISKLKYKWAGDISYELCDLVSQNLWRFDLPKDTVLVPVPLHAHRMNWRGFNQAELFSKVLAEKFKVSLGNYLKRRVETKSQVGLSKEERKRNLKDAFELLEPESKITGRTLVLVDDVFTTGSTLSAACKVLKKAGATSVWGLVLALG